MSFFDPQSIYTRKKYYSKKGCINQKKVPGLSNNLPNPAEEDQIPRSIGVLNAFGYTILPPGDHSYQNQNLSLNVNDVYYLSSEIFENNEGPFLSELHFLVLWNQVKDYFQQILSYEESNLNSFYLRFSVFSTDVRIQVTNKSEDSQQYDRGINYGNNSSNNQQTIIPSGISTNVFEIVSVNEDYYYSNGQLFNNDNSTTLLVDNSSNLLSEYSLLKNNTLDFVFGDIFVIPTVDHLFDIQIGRLIIPFSIYIQINLK